VNKTIKQNAKYFKFNFQRGMMVDKVKEFTSVATGEDYI